MQVDPWECYQDTWQTTCSVLEHHRDLMKRVTGCILSNVNTPSSTPVIDENANLGTVMRYEEIGVCLFPPACLSSVELRILLLCGSDLLDSFCIPGLWKDSDMEVIVGDFGIVVVPRDGADTEKIMNHSSILRKFKDNHGVKDEISHPMSIVSSTKSNWPFSTETPCCGLPESARHRLHPEEPALHQHVRINRVQNLLHQSPKPPSESKTSSIRVQNLLHQSPKPPSESKTSIRVQNLHQSPKPPHQSPKPPPSESKTSIRVQNLHQSPKPPSESKTSSIRVQNLHQSPKPPPSESKTSSIRVQNLHQSSKAPSESKPPPSESKTSSIRVQNLHQSPKPPPSESKTSSIRVQNLLHQSPKPPSESKTSSIRVQNLLHQSPKPLCVLSVCIKVRGHARWRWETRTSICEKTRLLNGFHPFLCE
ncbi:hypothetical protein F7725_010817 [Dissostichus mawsoni]|uniref:Uncharacterized protein n=1 Tax=Dissostichus mawsoni TaxID=36200 RepID=A0A7J5Z7I2_DISMA|nr:hypothetical protein F7725_010817 [Dissostichus mawsoni]